MPLRNEVKLKLCNVFSSNAEPEVKLRKVNVREFDGFNQLTSMMTSLKGLSIPDLTNGFNVPFENAFKN